MRNNSVRLKIYDLSVKERNQKIKKWILHTLKREGVFPLSTYKLRSFIMAKKPVKKPKGGKGGKGC